MTEPSRNGDAAEHEAALASSSSSGGPTLAAPAGVSLAKRPSTAPAADDALSGIQTPTHRTVKVEQLENERDELKAQLTRLNKPEDGLKIRRQVYKKEQAIRQEQLIGDLTDRGATIVTGFLKVRGSMKIWRKQYVELRPGVLVCFKDSTGREWASSVLLSGCEVIERPSKKQGFCFKVYHPLHHSIFMSRGPKGEPLPSGWLPINTDAIILRCPTEEEGRRWIDGIERAARSDLQHAHPRDQMIQARAGSSTLSMPSTDTHLSASDASTDKGHSSSACLVPDRSVAPSDDDDDFSDTEETEATEYEKLTDKVNVLKGEGGQVDTWDDGNKSIIMPLLRQVRPGMDLTRVALPTFILEPRSLLDRLSDYYFHVDVLADVIKKESPADRMTGIVKWYLSGFYNTPKGVKKPYNPIIGEVFRCYFLHPNGSKTFFVAEQVSHHPPVTAWYASNRKEGFTVEGVVYTRSQFNVTSVASVLEGSATLRLLERNETYTITFPTVYAKGFIVSPLVMELGSTISIKCRETGYSAEVEFLRKPMFGGKYNSVRGKILRTGGDEVVAIKGTWNDKLELVYDKSRTETLWHVTREVVDSRLPRFVPVKNCRVEKESHNLWADVTRAISNDDMTGATEGKVTLENQQRELHKRMKAENWTWPGVNFKRGSAVTDDKLDWHYKYPNHDKWNPAVDVEEVDHRGKIWTIRKKRLGASLSSDRRAMLTGAGSSTSTAGGGPDTSPSTPTVDFLTPSTPGAHDRTPLTGMAAVHATMAVSAGVSGSLEQELHHLKRRVAILESAPSAKKGSSTFPILLLLLAIFTLQAYTQFKVTVESIMFR